MMERPVYVVVEEAVLVQFLFYVYFIVYLFNDSAYVPVRAAPNHKMSTA
jgi:hypothetical protein